MLLMDIVRSFQVGDRAGNLENAGVGAGGEAEPVGDHLQETVARGVKFAVLTNMAGGHLGVGVNFRPFEALALPLAGSFNPAGYGGGAFTVGPLSQVAVFYRRDFDVNVDPIQQRAGNAGAVAVNIARSAGAGMIGVAQKTARAGVC